MANPNIPLSVRFEERVIPEPMSGCFLWIGSTSNWGYGNLSRNGKLEAAHRIAWEMARGPIPPGRKVLHGCDNRACVNVLHLHLGDDFDNMREMVMRGRSPNKMKTHCPHGHPYDEENTKLAKGRFLQRRQCRTCNRDIRARWRKRHGKAGGA